MTIDSSRNTHDSASARSHRALARLLDGLRHRGMAIGPDDAIRVATLFQHAENWSQTRCVRALSTLLARTDAERMLLKQLSPLLFQGQKRASTSLDSDTRELDEEHDHQNDEELIHRGPRRQQVTTEPSEDTEGSTHTRARKRTQLFSLAACIMVVVAAIAWFEWTRGIGTAVVGQIAGNVVEALSVRDDSDAAVAVEPHDEQGSGSLMATGSGGDECETELPAEIPVWPFVLGLLLLPIPAIWYARRWRRYAHQEANLEAVATSRGPRVWRLDASMTRLPVQPLDSCAVREGSFHLSAPTADAPAPWIDHDATVHATVRAGGRFELRWARWRKHSPVVLIEDIGSSMAVWPYHSQQLAAELQRHGGEVIHMYMHHTPDILMHDTVRNIREPLESVLARLDEPSVVVISDAAVLDRAELRRTPRWLRYLRNATWLHPAPPELWGEGARWLAEQLRVIPMNADGLMRLGTPHSHMDEELPPRWWPPRALNIDPVSAAQTLCSLFGEQSWLWLAAGAVLDQVDSLSARSWWQLRADEVVTDLPRERVERLWAAVGAHVASDGTIELPDQLSWALVTELRRRNPKLLTAVVNWLESMIQADLAVLEPKSPAALEARTTLARALRLDPRRQREARRHEHKLASEGYGSWLETGDDDSQRKSWRFRYRRTRRPTPILQPFAMAGLLGAVTCAILTFTPGLRDHLWPQDPQFYLKAEEPYFVTNEQPLTICRRYRVGSHIIFVKINGGEEFRYSAENASSNPLAWLLTAEMLSPNDELSTGVFTVQVGHRPGMPDVTWGVESQSREPIVLVLDSEPAASSGGEDPSEAIPVATDGTEPADTSGTEPADTNGTEPADTNGTEPAKRGGVGRARRGGTGRAKRGGTGPTTVVATGAVPTLEEVKEGISIVRTLGYEGITVQINGKSYTVPSGLEEIDLPAGSYSLTVKKPGCQIHRETIEIKKNKREGLIIPQLRCPRFKELIENAERLAIKSNYVEAQQLCERALKDRPGNSRAASVCAICACNLGKREAARHFYSMTRGDRRNQVWQVCQTKGINLVPL